MRECARRLVGGLRGSRSRGWTPHSWQNSGSVGILRRLWDPPALLSECSMAHALRTMSDTTRQKILTCPSRPGVRMRVRFSIL